MNKISKHFSHNSGNDKSKNTSNDVDIELYSLQYYLKLLYNGDTGAIDILHAKSNSDAVIIDSKEWDFIYNNRKDFYTKKLSAFVGYCRNQASKYSIKGSRLDALKKVIDFILLYDYRTKLKSFWNNLPEGEHIHFIEENGLYFYQICGKKFQDTVSVEYMYKVLNKIYKEYGHRAQQAAENKGIDWKAVSHAVRCALEMKEIYLNQDLKFPLKESDFILKIKKGELDYTTVVSPYLDKLMNEVELLIKNSTFPKKVNRKKFDKFILELYQKGILWKLKQLLFF